MKNVMFEELNRISGEMESIAKKSEQDGRTPSDEEQEILDQLAADRETLMGGIIFYGYG